MEVGSKQTYLASEEIVEYICSVSAPEHPVLAKCRRETSSHPLWSMQIGREQGPLFRVLLAMLHAKKTLEVGVFTGYSSTLTALALPPDGKLIACDVSEGFIKDARRYWAEAGVSDKIELRLGPAADSMRHLLKEGQGGSFDFAFIDADKTSYDDYYELALELLRPGGLVMFDNMLRSGKVIDAAVSDAEIQAIRALNKKLCNDDRVLTSLIPITDGTTLVWKKG